MNRTEKELTIFIQDWIYRINKSDELTVFTGFEAQYNQKQKMYFASEMEHKFVAEDIPQLADTCRGDLYRVVVKEEQDPRYGYQWRVTSATRIESVLIHEIRKFLTQQIKEKSLTHKRRDQLIEAYGAKIFDTILGNPASLDIIRADPNSKRRISRVIAENSGFAALLAFLAKRKWDCRWAIPLYKVYEDNAILHLRADPYRLYQHGLTGFKSADRVFLEGGGAVNDPLRCWRAVLAALHREEKQNGGTFIPRDKLRKKIASLLWDTDPNAKSSDCTISENDISKTLNWLEESKQIHIDCMGGKEIVYPLPLYQAEVRVAEELKVLCQTEKSAVCSADGIDQFLMSCGTNGVQLTATQRAAVKQMLTAPVSIITGGPGTGKTLLVKVAIDTLHELCPQAVVQCCAPTGKAAVRMPTEAATIDRLAANEKCKQFKRTDNRDPDIVFVDEISMVGIELFDKLLTVVPTGARLVLIGDKDQLPSIEAGQVLQDLIGSGIIHTIQLQEVFRQEAGSDILANAEKTIKTAPDQDIHLGEKGVGFAFNKHVSNPHRIPAAVIQAVEMVRKTGMPFADIQVICQTRSGEYGTRNLNHLMQDHFNFQEAENTFCCGSKEFRLNDRVIHIENNYDLNVMNGEVGEIIEVNHTKEHALTVRYPTKTIKYKEKELEELDLAYALTAHKCQGSEYSVVIIPIAGEGITSKWLYTAETRGRQLVLMIGTESALTAEMRRETADSRASCLAPRLKQLLPPILPEVEQTSLFPPAKD